MLRKLLAALVTFTLALSAAAATAEFSFFENDIPEEPIETISELASVVATYDAESAATLYTVSLADGAQFPDGTAITADDLLFSLYVRLDPDGTNSAAAALPIPGLTNYRAQISAAHYAEALTAMTAIEAAGPDHAWSEDDSWTSAAQSAYWSLVNAYESACEAEFPICTQKIVDASITWLTLDGAGAFGMTPAELIAEPALHVAYAMVNWGFAWCEDDLTLEGAYSGIIWKLDDGFTPMLDDFVNELKLAYDGDLGACWAIESAGDYEPLLPDVESEFVRALFAGTPDSVLSIDGIRRLDDSTLEIVLQGIDMHSAYDLFAEPILSLEYFGDASVWNPENGQYGHAFGSVADIESAESEDAGAHSVLLLGVEPEFTFSFG